MAALEKANARPAGLKRGEIATMLVEDSMLVVEQVAREQGMTPADVLRLLPDTLCRWAPGAALEQVMADVSGWGDVLFLVHTVNAIVEVKATIPPGRFGQGFFNLHGPGPLGGHISASRCADIAFVRRPFMRAETRSIQFYDVEGEGMFKIFVGRDAERRLMHDQLLRFDALEARLCPGDVA
jgi:putative heme utilization carrier protein HutX